MGEYLIAIFYIIAVRVFYQRLISEKAKKHLVAISMFPVFVLLAFKSTSVGTDSLNYYEYFDVVKYSTLDELFQMRNEKGYQLLMKIITSVFSDPQWQFIIVGFFITIAVGIFVYKYSKEPTLSILFYMTFGLFAFNLTGLRQSLAMATCLFAFKYICERKLVKFFLVIIIATTFHTSAVFFIPAYFIAYRKINKVNIFINLIIFVLIVFNAEQLMLLVTTLFATEYGIEQTDSGMTFFIIMLIITIVSLLLKKELLELNPNNLLFINLNFITAAFWGLRLISRTAERPAMFYMFASVILLEQILVAVKDRQVKQLMTIAAMSLSCALFIYRLFGNESIYPYSFFFE